MALASAELNVEAIGEAHGQIAEQSIFGVSAGSTNEPQTPQGCAAGGVLGVDVLLERRVLVRVKAANEPVDALADGNGRPQLLGELVGRGMCEHRNAPHAEQLVGKPTQDTAVVEGAIELQDVVSGER